MRVNKRESILIFVFFVLLVVTYLVFNNSQSDYLKVSFLNIGQGDSILFQTPTGGKILIDGGRDDTVLTRLGTELPILTKNIDLVIATHDDSDHIAGLISVLKKYNVKVLLYSLSNSENLISKELIKLAN